MPISETPERMTLTDLQNNQTVEVMFNPSELTRRTSVNYAKKAVLGNSHMPHEYLQTDNMQLRFDLFYNVETPIDRGNAAAAIRFLESLAYAPDDPESIAGAAPPRVLLVWPRTMSIIARLTQIEFAHQRWNLFGDTTQWTAACTFEESRIRRLSKQDVRVLGALRQPQSQGKLIE
jgi:hypothetical protein